VAIFRLVSKNANAAACSAIICLVDSFSPQSLELEWLSQIPSYKEISEYIDPSF